MTNYENIKDKILETTEMFQILDIRGASNYGYEDDMPWCKYPKDSNRFYCHNHCLDCFKAWLDKPINTPMPAIKNGDYVFIKNCGMEDETMLGVVVDDTVVYENGRWDFIKDIIDDIIIISQGPGFEVAKSENSYIWRKNG